MDAPQRLVTSVELREEEGQDVDRAGRMSVSALHELELASGRRVLLLDDRGWTSQVMGPGADLWAGTTVDSVVQDARVVVGPDEPVDGSSPAQAEADHWAHLSARAREQGVAVGPDVLAALPHDVDVGESLRARLDGSPG